jgi:hypothetical protein
MSCFMRDGGFEGAARRVSLEGYERELEDQRV